MRAPEAIETERLLLRRPTRHDVPGIFTRYASDPEVTRYLAWPRHLTVDDTMMFLRFSDAEWRLHGYGPYLVWSKSTALLLGSTGLTLEASRVAQTGYVFARDAWGLGYATESLEAMVTLARAQALKRLYAMCHADHRASIHVLEKCGFVLESSHPQSHIFPNLSALKQHVLTYARALED